MAPPTVRQEVQGLRREVGELREQTGDTKSRVDQLRRAFGFNGKLEDTEAESIVRETFVEMKALAVERRSEIQKHQAYSVVKADLGRRLHFLRIRDMRDLITKVLYAFLGGIGFVLAEKSGELFGFLRALEVATIHHPIH